MSDGKVVFVALDTKRIFEFARIKNIPGGVPAKDDVLTLKSGRRVKVVERHTDLRFAPDAGTTLYVREVHDEAG